MNENNHLLSTERITYMLYTAYSVNMSAHRSRLAPQLALTSFANRAANQAFNNLECA